MSVSVFLRINNFYVILSGQRLLHNEFCYKKNAVSVGNAVL